MYESNISEDTQFGLKNNKIIHISEIPDDFRGLKCECICPKCGDNLIARKGSKNKHHFAHENIKECQGSLETALHLFAKEVLERSKSIAIPKIDIGSIIRDHWDDPDDWDVLVSEYECFMDPYEIGYTDISYYEEHKIETKNVISESVLIFDEVKSEQRIDDIIADIVLIKGNRELIIEIKVTHEVDSYKAKKIRDMKKSAMEIDLGKGFVDYYNFDRKLAEQTIINNIELKEWIFNAIADKEKSALKNELLDKLEKMKKDMRKQEKLRRIKEERRRVYEEKNAVNRKQRVEKILSNEYQDKMKKRYAAIVAHDPVLKRALKYLNISLNEIPEYLNHEIEGEIIFKCDRRVWQTHIFNSFINNWKKRKHSEFFKVEYVINWLKKKSPELIDWNYVWDIKKLKDDGDYLSQPDLADVLCDFFLNLENYGIVVTSESTLCNSNCPPYYHGFVKIAEGIL